MLIKVPNEGKAKAHGSNPQISTDTSRLALNTDIARCTNLAKPPEVRNPAYIKQSKAMSANGKQRMESNSGNSNFQNGHLRLPEPKTEDVSLV